MDNEVSEEYWNQCVALLEKKVACLSPIKIREDYIQIVHKIEQKSFFLQIGQYGYQKNAEFYADSKLTTKLRKNTTCTKN